MIVEALCRFSKELSKKALEEINEELNVLSITMGDKFDERIERARLTEHYNKFEYAPKVFNMNDVMNFNRADEIHTSIWFYGGGFNVFKVNYQDFKDTYQAMKGVLITTFIESKQQKEKNHE